MDDNDEDVRNIEDASLSASAIPLGWTRVSVIRIMESWPLQLRLSYGQEDFFVDLAPDVIVESRFGAASVKAIFPKQQIDVLIELVSKQPDVYQVSHVKILETNRDQ